MQPLSFAARRCSASICRSCSRQLTQYKPIPRHASAFSTSAIRNQAGGNHPDWYVPEPDLKFPKDRDLDRRLQTQIDEHKEIDEEFEDAKEESFDSYEYQVVKEKKDVGLMAEGELGEGNLGLPGDDEFEGDDITSMAHAELMQHQELREYMRLAAWEMPRLTKFAKEFVPPSAEEVLRFRYTTYMGEHHPAEKKVVMEFCPADMPDLTDVQLSKLIKLLGPRYNPETEIAKMSCEMFSSQAQNKRYLGDMIDKLLAEARDPTDTFADVPFDFRHHKFKPVIKFPKEWRMTEQRQQFLQNYRAQAALRDTKLENAGQLGDGVRQIEAALERQAAAKAAEPEMVPVQRGGKGAGARR